MFADHMAARVLSLEAELRSARERVRVLVQQRDMWRKRAGARPVRVTPAPVEDTAKRPKQMPHGTSAYCWKRP